MLPKETHRFNAIPVIAPRMFSDLTKNNPDIQMEPQEAQIAKAIFNN